MRGQHKITLVVEELEEEAIGGLIKYLFNSISEIGAKPVIVTNEAISYSPDNNFNCEVCGSNDVTTQLFSTDIDMGNGILIPFRSKICDRCYHSFEATNSFDEMVGKVVDSRRRRWS